MTAPLEGNAALVFPGQGAQFVGMARTLADASPIAKGVIERADETLGIALSDLMFNGPAEELEDTINAQPAILTASIAALEAVKHAVISTGRTLSVSMVAGHSLGEFSALVAAGVIDFPTALKLVRERGRVMKAAGVERPGGMAAILGVDDDVLREVCKEVGELGTVVVANSNCPGQTVISGEVTALERAMELARERGARRVARLGVSIASHSPLMSSASRQFAEIVATTTMATPQIPIYANITAQPLTEVGAIRDEISRQIQSPVNWTGTIQNMISAGADTFLELGPGSVIAGLIKRINRDVRTRSIADLELGLPPMTSA